MDGNNKKLEVKIKDNVDIICFNIIFYYVGRIDLLENFFVRFFGGKFIVLIGEFGCGKSMVVKLIVGLYFV